MLTFGNNLKLEIIDYIFRKIITLNEVNILESPNEYYQQGAKVLKADRESNLTTIPVISMYIWV